MFPLEGVWLCPAHLGTTGNAPLGLGVNHQEDGPEKGAGFHCARSMPGPPEPGKLLRSPCDPAGPPPRASLRAKSRHAAQFCRQHPEGGRKVRGPGPARVPPLPAGAGPPACVRGSVRGVVEPHRGDGPASATAPARDAVVTPQPPRLCPQGWVAPGAGCVGSEASVSPAERPGLGRVLPLGPRAGPGEGGGLGAAADPKGNHGRRRLGSC